MGLTAPPPGRQSAADSVQARWRAQAGRHVACRYGATTGRAYGWRPERTTARPPRRRRRCRPRSRGPRDDRPRTDGSRRRGSSASRRGNDHSRKPDALRRGARHSIDHSPRRSPRAPGSPHRPRPRRHTARGVREPDRRRQPEPPTTRTPNHATASCPTTCACRSMPSRRRRPSTAPNLPEPEPARTAATTQGADAPQPRPPGEPTPNRPRCWRDRHPARPPATTETVSRSLSFASTSTRTGRLLRVHPLSAAAHVLSCRHARHRPRAAMAATGSAAPAPAPRWSAVARTGGGSRIRLPRSTACARAIAPPAPRTKVMQASARTALSWVRADADAERFGLNQ